MIQVRQATEEDKTGIAQATASAVTTLRKTYRPNKRARENKSRLARRLKQLVATIDQEIAGAVEYEIKGDTLFVIGLDVHEKYRRMGVAKEFIGYLTTLSVRSNARRLCLHTISETGNVPVFKKLGFSVISETTDDFSESDVFESLTDVHMEKTI